MRGQIIGVWSETWLHIWRPLADHGDAPPDIFSELYRELLLSFVSPPSTQEMADIVSDPEIAREAFEQTPANRIRGEMAAIEFLERAFAALTGFGSESLTNQYFLLLSSFMEKFSLRYDLRRPFALCPTLPGVFAALVRELREVALKDADLHPLMLEFEDAIRDLRQGLSGGRIKSCIQKEINFLEGMGQKCPGVTTKTLGRICDEVGSWPHTKVKEAMKNLYAFASDYPGIRHGGTPGNVLRHVEPRDLIAVSVLLTGFAPYLTDRVNSEMVYIGSDC